MEDWASLLPEHLQAIADCVLLTTTGGVDAYMNMRAVCSSWRTAIAKPSPLAAVADRRFRPRHWVMVDMNFDNYGEDGRLFLHIPTGRFRRLRLPVLRDHLLFGGTDGLLVLGDREPPHMARVLNPLTGDMLHFAAPLQEHLGSADDLYIAVGGGPHSLLVVCLDSEWRWHTVLYDDPTSAEFTQEDIGTNYLSTMVTFQGNIYLAGVEGSVLKFVRPEEQQDHGLVVTAQMSPDVDIYLEEDNCARSYLVESAGELLLVRHGDQAMKVFKVDVERKLLEEVKSIGGCRALFLGAERCVSVDADMLPSVEGDCIYMSNWVESFKCNGHCMHVYNLRDNTMEISIEPIVRTDNHPLRPLRPLSLIQVLLNYCNDLTWMR